MKYFNGKVISDKMKQTVVVSVEHAFRHPMYNKRVITHKKYHAHNPNGAKIGDLVRIAETKPISATKKFIVVEILK